MSNAYCGLPPLTPICTVMVTNGKAGSLLRMPKVAVCVFLPGLVSVVISQLTCKLADEDAGIVSTCGNTFTCGVLGLML